MRILISNDDGVMAPGIAALHGALQGYAECAIVAPTENKSGASSRDPGPPAAPATMPNGYIGLRGTPTDCVHRVSPCNWSRCRTWSCRDQPAHGEGDGVGIPAPWRRPSGASARPAFAFSLVSRRTDNLATAAYFARKLVEAHEQLDLPPRTVLNVNVPNLPLDRIRGIQLTRLGHRARAAAPVKMVNPPGQGGLLDLCPRRRRTAARASLPRRAAGLRVDHAAAARPHPARSLRRPRRLAGGPGLMRGQDHLQRQGVGMTSQRTRERA